MAKRYTFGDVKKHIEENGYQLTSTEYKNNSTKLKMICDKGHECEISFANFKNKGRRCSKCYGNKKLTYKEVKEEFEKEGYKLISEEYNNANEKLKVRCPNNHKWEVAWGKFQSGRRCPYCSGKFINHQVAKEFIENCGYKILEGIVNIGTDRIKLSCPHNHVYETTFNNFKSGRRCPQCNQSKGENAIINILAKYDIKNNPQHIFDDCKFYRVLPFDFYLPNYNIAIEYDGEFHYNMLMGFDEFVNGKIRDTIKTNYCKENNIQLIRIPYWEFDNIEKILIKELNLK